jgi:hypothetical protein
MFTVAIQDENCNNLQLLGREYAVEASRAFVAEIASDMEATKVADCSLAEARAEMDLDGEFIEAAWFALEGERTLIAIVKIV